MEILLIVSDGPADVGRAETALRLASALLRAEDAVVRVFLTNEAVRLATIESGDEAAQHPAHGISALVNAGAVVGVSDTGMRERRIATGDLVIGAEPAGISMLAAWCLESDRLMVF